MPTINVKAALGASEAADKEQVTLYIPTRDRDGTLFDAQPWLEEALTLLAGIGGGATALAPASGAWINPETGTLVTETVHLIYAYSDPTALASGFRDIREFLHDLGRETNQGEVVVEISDRFYRITIFDEAEEGGRDDSPGVR